MRKPTPLLILLFAVLPESSIASPQPHQELVSSRLSSLQKDVEAGKSSALEGFWRDIAKQGAPLVEPIHGDERNLLVTFLWRSKEATNVVIMCDFGANVRSRVLTRLGGTDVWYKTYRMPNDARFFYQYSVDDPNFPFEGEPQTKFPTKFQADPLNPRQYDFTKLNIFSVVELPAATSLEMSTPDASVPRGVVGRFSQPFASKILGNERAIFVYKPAGYSDAAEPYPLLIFGASYINQIRLPAILDKLIARRRIPPVVVIFVGFPQSGPGQNVQDGERVVTSLSETSLPRSCFPGYANEFM